MQSTSKAVIMAVLSCFAAAPALAQDDLGRDLRFRSGDKGSTRVQSNFVISVPIEKVEDTTEKHEAALRLFYKLAATSCAMVVETIADSCEMTNVTTNVDSRDRGASGPQITVTGQITMQVKFKSETGKSAP